MNQSKQLLKDKWIVVTRPEHQAEQLCKKLKQAGAEVILFPLIEISPPDDLSLTKHQLSKLTEYDLIIFVSPNAVEECLKWFDAKTLPRLNIATVGAKTAAKLLSHGIQVQISPQNNYNSEALLALPEIQKLGFSASDKNHKVAILRGEGGRELLKETLEKQGCTVDYIELYKRSCPQNSLDTLKNKAKENQLDIILITSGTSIDHLFSLQEENNDNDWLNNVPLLVGSERIKQQVLSSTSHHGALISTENPSDENLLEKLLEWSKP
jgi:uroporphyrinogen-III synthase